MSNESDRYKTKLLPRKSWSYSEVATIKEEDPISWDWIVCFICCLIVGSILLFAK